LPLLFVVRRFRVLSRRFRPYGLQSAEFSKVGSSENFLGGSELWNIAVTVLDLGVFIPLGPPTAILLLPLAQYAVLTLISHLAFTPNLLSSKSLPSID
jgi:hypothetical protein